MQYEVTTAQREVLLHWCCDAKWQTATLRPRGWGWWSLARHSAEEHELSHPLVRQSESRIESLRCSPCPHCIDSGLGYGEDQTLLWVIVGPGPLRGSTELSASGGSVGRNIGKS